METDPDKLVHQFSEWLTEADSKNTGRVKIVIVLDGINRLEKRAQNLYWLPTAFPPSVRIILSTPSASVETTTPLSSKHNYRKLSLRVI